MKILRNTYLTILVLAILLSSNYVIAQANRSDSASLRLKQESSIHVTKNELPKPDGLPIEIGRRMKMQSNILNQEREFLVYLPASYHSKDYLPKSYPVLFLFDAEVQFTAVAGIIDYMAGLGGQIPEMIIVGIPHQNRTQELTPTHAINDFREGKTSETLADSGGGDEFLRFVTEELIPKVDREYRTRPYRILFGHSFGGLLVAHAFLKPNEDFQAFILADPSLWWDDRILIKRLQTMIADGRLAKRKRAIFVSRVTTYKSPDNKLTQKGFENISNSITAFEELLRTTTTIRHKVQLFSPETHTSVPVPTLYHGLLHVFDGYEPAPDLFLRPVENLMDHFESVSTKVGLKLLPGEQLIDMWANAFLNYDEEFRERALPLFELNAANYPDSPNSHASLGSAYVQLGKLDMARKSFETALQLNAENETAKTGLRNLPRK